MMFLAGVFVGFVLLAVLVGVAAHRYPKQYDDVIEYVRK